MECIRLDLISNDVSDKKTVIPDATHTIGFIPCHGIKAIMIIIKVIPDARHAAGFHILSSYVTNWNLFII